MLKLPRIQMAYEVSLVLVLQGARREEDLLCPVNGRAAFRGPNCRWANWSEHRGEVSLLDTLLLTSLSCIKRCPCYHESAGTWLGLIISRCPLQDHY